MENKEVFICRGCAKKFNEDDMDGCLCVGCEKIYNEFSATTHFILSLNEVIYEKGN